MKSPTEKFILTADEAAAFLSISKSTLLRLTANQQLQKIKISDKRVGWVYSELVRFVTDKQKEE